MTANSQVARRRVFQGAWIALSVAALVGCGSDSTSPGKTVASISITPVNETIEAMNVIDLDATVLDEDDAEIPNAAVAWSSNNTSVATVHPTTGVVTGVDRGTATITATSGGETATADITVEILYRSLALGDYLSCDLQSIGVPRCWGELGDNTGTTVEESPVAVGGTVKFASLTAYSRTICGRTSTGAAYCWGPNGEGQLGTGNNTGTKVPVAVSGGINFKSLSAGDVTTCGVSTAGVGYCWGDNSYAQAGHSSTADVNVPTVVQGSHTFSMISAGTVSACGVTTTNQIYCWGSDTYGQLGDGGTISYSSLDTAALPVLVAGGLSWSMVSVGQFHACGLTTAGAAYCWGYNDYRVGDNTTTDRSSPVAVSGGLTFKSIEAGRYTTCGITTADVAYCWGANLAGQFGVDLPGDLSRVPVQAFGGMQVSEISTSSLEHTCAISLDRLTVKCAGRNDYGQGGNGGTVASTVHNWTPTVVVDQEP